MASRVRKQDLYNVASTDDRSGKKIKTAHKGGDAALHAAFVSLLKTPLASLLFLALPSTLRLKQKKLRAKEKGGQTAPTALTLSGVVYRKVAGTNAPSGGEAAVVAAAAWRPLLSKGGICIGGATLQSATPHLLGADFFAH